MKIAIATKRLSLILALSTLCLLSACSPQKEIIIHEKQAPNNIRESFAIQDDSKSITIKKSALGKAYLVLPSTKTSGRIAVWQDSSPIIVSFEKSGNTIGLFEQTDSVYDSIKPEKLLGSFEVIKETEDSISFNWGQGLKSLPLKPAIDSPFKSQAELSLEDAGYEPGLLIKDTFVRRAIIEDQDLVIEQISRVQSSQLLEPSEIIKEFTDQSGANIATLETTLSLNLQIRPYNLSKAFRKIEQDPEERIGFFGVRATEKNKAKSKNLISHWDMNEALGPIRAIISDETPKEFRSAIEEGVLYWNKVAGRTVISIEYGNTSRPDRDRTISVRWIPWEDAGFAYASFQSDPLTGELIRAQVFMTSTFAEQTKIQNQAGAITKPLHPVQHGNVVCYIEQKQLALDFAETKTPEVQKEAVKDMIRMVMAHEIGHTLGLRHNFIGSASAKLNNAQIEAAIDNYSKDKDFIGLATATTVMDYVFGDPGLLLGRAIKKQVLDYDKMALDFANHGLVGDEQISKFCADEHIIIANISKTSVYGCERADFTQNPIQHSLYINKDKIKNSIRKTLLRLLSQVNKKGGAVTDAQIEEIVTVSSQKHFDIFFDDISSLKINTIYTTFKKPDDLTMYKNFISLESAKKAVAISKYILNKELNDEYDPDLEKQIEADLKEAGGLAQVFRQVLNLNEQGSFNPENFTNIVTETLQNMNLHKIQDYQTEWTLTEPKAQKLKVSLQQVFVQDKVFASYLLSLLRSILPLQESIHQKDSKPIQISRVLMRSAIADPIEQARLTETLVQILTGRLGSISYTVTGKDGTTGQSDYPKTLLNELFIEEIIKILTTEVFSGNSSIAHNVKKQSFQAYFKKLQPALSSLGVPFDENDLNFDAIKKSIAKALSENRITQELATHLTTDVRTLEALKQSILLDLKT